MRSANAPASSGAISERLPHRRVRLSVLTVADYVAAGWLIARKRHAQVTIAHPWRLSRMAAIFAAVAASSSLFALTALPLNADRYPALPFFALAHKPFTVQRPQHL